MIFTKMINFKNQMNSKNIGTWIDLQTYKILINPKFLLYYVANATRNII